MEDKKVAAWFFLSFPRKQESIYVSRKMDPRLRDVPKTTEWWLSCVMNAPVRWRTARHLTAVDEDIHRARKSKSPLERGFRGVFEPPPI